MTPSDPRTGKRKTVNMGEGIAQELNRLANLEGKTLYSLINEMGAQALEANSLGFSLDDAIAAKRLVDGAKRSRMMIVNQDMWYFASALAMKASRRKWTKMVADTAQWQASVLLERNGASGIKELLRSIRRFVEDFIWDCTEFRVDEVDESQGIFTIRLALVPETPLDTTRAVFKTLEVMVNQYGCVAVKSGMQPGFFTASFKRVESPR
ncbi:MAG: hypothetical protein JRN51_08425 [Nitrososphaerota archaeon]|nr:hypothetical protein [Nitrososphaerota archaeon]MDG6981117.1 hypothetical protein [Nitrososphaerota archaeon]